MKSEEEPIVNGFWFCFHLRLKSIFHHRVGKAFEMTSFCQFPPATLTIRLLCSFAWPCWAGGSSSPACLGLSFSTPLRGCEGGWKPNQRFRSLLFCHRHSLWARISVGKKLNFTQTLICSRKEEIYLLSHVMGFCQQLYSLFELPTWASTCLYFLLSCPVEIYPSKVTM